MTESTDSDAGVTYVRTADIPLDELTPFPGNAKRGDVDAIRKSLRRNGQYRSLVVREIPDGPLIVLAGNHTMQGLAAEGHETARCEVVVCDDNTARRINLADNRTAELGENDKDALAELISYLDGDYEGTGYTDEDVAALIVPPQLPEEGDAPIEDTEATWGVIVECLDEQQQTELLERLAAEGRRVRALMA
jgi:ParB-like chromosome segregation protein Spo0J